MILNHNGQRFEITNFDEFKHDFLSALGFQVTGEIVTQINKLRLVDTGKFKGSVAFVVRGDELIITSSAPHAPFLEYGTAGREKGVVDPFGERSRGPNASRKYPMRKVGREWGLVPSLERWAKKKGFSEDSFFVLANKIVMQGSPAYAPFRKVLYDREKMAVLVRRAVKAARDGELKRV